MTPLYKPYKLSNLINLQLMRLLSSQIVGKPIGALEDRAKVGIVKSIIINPEDGALLALEVKSSFFSLKTKVISWRDIYEFDQSAVLINSKDNIVDPSELVRVEQLLRDNYSLSGLPVLNKKGLNFGQVIDFSVDTESGTLFNIHIKKLFHKSRIISRSKIIEIDMEKVLIRADNEEKLPVIKPVESPA